MIYSRINSREMKIMIRLRRREHMPTRNRIDLSTQVPLNTTERTRRKTDHKKTLNRRRPLSKTLSLSTCFRRKTQATFCKRRNLKYNWWETQSKQTGMVSIIQALTNIIWRSQKRNQIKNFKTKYLWEFQVVKIASEARTNKTCILALYIVKIQSLNRLISFRIQPIRTILNSMGHSAVTTKYLPWTTWDSQDRILRMRSVQCKTPNRTTLQAFTPITINMDINKTENWV